MPATAGLVDDDKTVTRLNRRSAGQVMVHQGPGGVANWTAQLVSRAVIELLAAIAEPKTHRRCVRRIGLPGTSRAWH